MKVLQRDVPHVITAVLTNKLGSLRDFLFAVMSRYGRAVRFNNRLQVLSKYLFITTLNLRASSCCHGKRGTNCTG